MSDVYRKFRGQMAAGGDTQDLAEESGGRNSSLSLVLLAVFFVWLGATNPWMLVFVIGLIISIFLHEFGHYWTARKTGMKVTQFYMGFGPRLWSRKRGELEYGIRAIPLGAFVRIIGMSNLDDCDPADESRSYRSKSYPRRLLVITAGSLMHMAIALTLFIGVYSVAGRLGETGSVRIVYAPVSGSPAAAIGLREGDVGQGQLQIAGILDLLALQCLAGKGADRDRHVADLFLALLRRDDDFIIVDVLRRRNRCLHQPSQHRA